MGSKVLWVEQVDKGGCSIACAAMLLGTTYARVREMAPQFCGACGVDPEQLDHFLAEHGLAVRRLFRFSEHTGEARAKWPPKPFAELHLVMVSQTKKDADAYQHYVVMDGVGNVYDPSDPEYKKCRLSRYYRVEWVAGIYKVA